MKKFISLLILGFSIITSSYAYADQTSLKGDCESRLVADGSAWSPKQASVYCSCYVDSIFQEGNLPASYQQKILNSRFEGGSDAAKTLGFQPYCSGCTDEQFSAYNTFLDVVEKCSKQAIK